MGCFIACSWTKGQREVAAAIWTRRSRRTLNADAAKVPQEGGMLIESRQKALKKATVDKEAEGGVRESERPGYSRADALYVGTMKNVGWICEQTSCRPVLV